MLSLDVLLDASAFGIASKRRMEVPPESAASPALLARHLANALGLEQGLSSRDMAVEVPSPS